MRSPRGTAAARAPLAMPKPVLFRDQRADLWGAVIEHGFPPQRWVTFRQALGLRGNVRKGERGATVVRASSASRGVLDTGRDEPGRAPAYRGGVLPPFGGKSGSSGGCEPITLVSARQAQISSLHSGSFGAEPPTPTAPMN